MTQTTLLSRISRLFARKSEDQAVDTAAEGQIERAEPKPEVTVFPFWKRFGRRDAAIANIQQGFNTLTGLMTSIRDNLDRQSRRQEELLGYLSHLPALVQSLPEAQRAHGESLKAIGQQIEHQVQQQQRLADILDRVSETEGGQTKAMATLSGGVQALGEHNEAISANLRQVSSAMEVMGRSSESSAQVLKQISSDLATRGEQMQAVIQRQSTRMTTLLIVAMGLSIAAIITVSILGILLLK